VLRNTVETTSPFNHIPQVLPPFVKGDRGGFKAEFKGQSAINAKSTKKANRFKRSESFWYEKPWVKMLDPELEF